MLQRFKIISQGKPERIIQKRTDTEVKIKNFEALRAIKGKKIKEKRLIALGQPETVEVAPDPRIVVVATRRAEIVTNVVPRTPAQNPRTS